MYKIQANASGTREIEVSVKHLLTIDRHSLFRNLVDSNGIVGEDVLDKLKFNVRSMLESGNPDGKALLDLSLDVIYNKDMKAFGLQKLIKLYDEWHAHYVEQDKEETVEQ